MDYLDWLSIQNKLKKTVPEIGIEIDESIKDGNFAFYNVKEKNAYELFRKNERYTNICVFADKMPEMVQMAKEFCLREYA